MFQCSESCHCSTVFQCSESHERVLRASEFRTEHQSIFLLFFCASVVNQIFSSKTCRNAATIDHTSRERVTVCSFFFFVKTNLLLTIADVVRHHPFHHNKTVNLPRVPARGRIGAQCRRISHAGAPHTLPGSGRRGKLAWW